MSEGEITFHVDCDECTATTHAGAVVTDGSGGVYALNLPEGWSIVKSVLTPNWVIHCPEHRGSP